MIRRRNRPKEEINCEMSMRLIFRQQERPWLIGEIRKKDKRRKEEEEGGGGRKMINLLISCQDIGQSSILNLPQSCDISFSSCFVSSLHI